jgi:subfamily B ATP-binding cassette protein MsbA
VLSKRLFKDDRSVRRDDDSLVFAPLTIRKVVVRLMRDYVFRHPGVLTLTVVAMILTASTTGGLPFLMQITADDIFVGKNEAMLYTLPLVVVGVMTVRAFAEYGTRVGEAYLEQRLLADIRIQLFAKLLASDLGWLQTTHTGRFVAVFMHDVGIVNRAAVATISGVFKNVLQIIALGFAMVWMDWFLSLIVMSVLPVGAVLLRMLRGRVERTVKFTMQETGDLGRLLTQVLQGVRVVKSYRQEDREVERVERTIERAVEFAMRIVRTRSAAGPIMEGAAGIGIAAAIFYGGWQGITGELTPGHFMGFMTASMLIYKPVKAVANLFYVLIEGVAAASRVFGIIDRAAKVVDQPGARGLVARAGSIKFEGVTFAYDGVAPVVRNFSLDIPAGSRVALVGPSGAGKSTILNLVLRLFDPQSGKVLIDGQELRHSTIASVRDATALLTQEPVLFDDTILANITYGSEEATREQVVIASRAAAAHEFIELLPKGYDSPVGESGNLMSGGQKQRIAFARAILRNSPIVLLDEPTSALDAQAEAKVQHAMDTLLKGRTVLMIAHRLSTVRKADLICVMEEGRIVETGQHAELVARGGLYSRLYAVQARGQDTEEVAKVVTAVPG